jgi:DNA mismatch endonuclease (patch repair protein)
VDFLTPSERSKLMARIRGKNTVPEMAVRSALHRLGYRYSLHARDLPGKPDLVFRSRRKVIFVHGCFWHGHACRKDKPVAKSNVSFWMEKISGNARRDARVRRALRKEGWGVLTLWQCELKRVGWLTKAVSFLERTGDGA